MNNETNNRENLKFEVNGLNVSPLQWALLPHIAASHNFVAVVSRAAVTAVLEYNGGEGLSGEDLRKGYKDDKGAVVRGLKNVALYDIRDLADVHHPIGRYAYGY